MRPKYLAAALLVATISVAAAGCSSDSGGSGVSGNVSASHPTTSASTPAPASTPSSLASSFAPTTPAPSTGLALGTTGITPIGAVTVYSVDYPVTGSEQAERIKPAGKDFAVADLQVCPSVNQVNLSSFRLLASDNTSYTFWNVQIGAEDPNLVPSLAYPAVGVCTRGLLTFPVDPGKSFTRFVVAGGSGTSSTWALS